MIKRIKKVIGLCVLLLVSGLITSCKESIKADDAGILFVNQLIYEEDPALFEENFIDGKEVRKQIKQQKEELVEDIVNNINQFGGVFSAKQTEEMVEKWIEKMETTTKFQLKSVKPLKKNKYEVFFTVTGLDFTKMYEEVMNDFVGRMLANPEIKDNSYKLGDLMVETMNKKIDTIQMRDKTVTVSLVVEKDGIQWKINSKEREVKVKQILLAFLSGFASEKDLGDAMNKAIENAMSEGQALILEEYEGDNNNSSDENKEEKSEKEDSSNKGQATQSKKDEEQTKDSSKSPESPGEVTIETEETYEDDSSSSSN